MTQEREKLERIITLIVKLLITMYIINVLFNDEIKLFELISNKSLAEFKISGLITSIFYLVVTWFVVWNILVELILFQIVIGAIAKIGKDEDSFRYVLLLLGVMNKNSKPSKNVHSFSHTLNKFDGTHEIDITEEVGRIKDITSILIIYFILSMLVPELVMPVWLSWIIGIVILNMIFTDIIIQKGQKFFNENYFKIRNQINAMSYYKTVFDGINDCFSVNKYYSVTDILSTIQLFRMFDKFEVPKSIKVIPLYFENKEQLEWHFTMKKMTGQGNTSIDKNSKITVFVSNLESNTSIKKKIKANSNFAFLLCKNQNDVKTNIEILLSQLELSNQVETKS